MKGNCMKLIVEGSHLKDRPEPSVVPIRFSLANEGFDVLLGHIPIAFLEEQTDGYRIRTMPGHPSLSMTFINLHSAVCATEHLIQCGGSMEWMKWGAEALDLEHMTVNFHIEPS